ncbi:MAG: SDR family oxidoreductase [Planctomycetes bacterium]|nr:SDR family oxidoreductase [Planctomycetota bacterium]
MRVLVTGGAGFIGSHLVRHLLRRGDHVRVIDNLSAGQLGHLSEIREHIEWIQGDLRDETAIENALQGIEGVFHQGAIPSVPRSFREPALFHEVNVSGSLHLLLASLRARVRRMVMASSSSVYGDTEVQPKVESLPTRPLSPYAVTKLAAESYGRVFSRSMGIEVVSLRYFNVYGPRQSVAAQYAAVIPSFITSALQNRPLKVEGDGDQTRDFTFVEDAAQANLLAMDVPQAAGEVFNISGNCRVSINELVRFLQGLMPDRTLEVVHAPPRPGDIRHSWADTSKARTILGYVPRVGLEEGLRRTIRYFEEQLTAPAGRS